MRVSSKSKHMEFETISTFFVFFRVLSQIFATAGFRLNAKQVLKVVVLNPKHRVSHPGPVLHICPATHPHRTASMSGRILRSSKVVSTRVSPSARARAMVLSAAPNAGKRENAQKRKLKPAKGGAKGGRKSKTPRLVRAISADAASTLISFSKASSSQNPATSGAVSSAAAKAISGANTGATARAASKKGKTVASSVSALSVLSPAVVKQLTEKMKDMQNLYAQHVAAADIAVVQEQLEHEQEQYKTTETERSKLELAVKTTRTNLDCERKACENLKAALRAKIKQTGDLARTLKSETQQVRKCEKQLRACAKRIQAKEQRIAELKERRVDGTQVFQELVQLASGTSYDDNLILDAPEHVHAEKSGSDDSKESSNDGSDDTSGEDSSGSSSSSASSSASDDDDDDDDDDSESEEATQTSKSKKTKNTKKMKKTKKTKKAEAQGAQPDLPAWGYGPNPDRKSKVHEWQKFFTQKDWQQCHKLSPHCKACHGWTTVSHTKSPQCIACRAWCKARRRYYKDLSYQAARNQEQAKLVRSAVKAAEAAKVAKTSKVTTHISNAV